MAETSRPTRPRSRHEMDGTKLDDVLDRVICVLPDAVRAPVPLGVGWMTEVPGANAGGGKAQAHGIRQLR